jgi:hypothetical protein
MGVKANRVVQAVWPEVGCGGGTAYAGERRREHTGGDGVSGHGNT